MKNSFKYVVFQVVFFFSFVINYNGLTNISVEGYSLNPMFDINTMKYNVFVEENIESINIVVDTEVGETLTGNGFYNLVKGMNEIIIYSISSSNIPSTYKIVVHRGYNNINYFNSALLKELDIKGYTINFDQNIFSYSINVNEIDKLDINYKSVSEFSEVIVEGNKDFIEGNNLISITVTSYDKEVSNIYTINVNLVNSVFKENNKVIASEKVLTQKEKTVLAIFLVIIFSMLIILLFSILFLRKKSSNSKT